MKKPTTQIGARLLKILNEKGISMRAASLGAGLSESAAKHVIYGSSQSPRLTTISQIAAYLDIPTSEITGSDAQQKNAAVPIHTTQIEVRGDVQAGVWREAIEWPQADWYAITVPIDTAYQGFHRYGLKVCGQSMNKVFPEGSVVVVINFGDLGRLPKTGDFVVAVQRCSKTDQFEATVKAVQIRDDGTVILWPQSWDPAFQTPVVLPPQDGHDHAGVPDVAIQALVVGSYQSHPKASF
ncbi:hypothetical protein AD929_15820 [Gluconobacter potus]|uniref:HTH cro/C1-type domain-containing protein n=1 Tax=Gluconobacter potus TaxID=2724927 RepID=A0A149QPN8_9PROT|nr:S24 family peptidase [Gluconobacter potus]KXU99259.1 hypothetical protein AD929_15820 [Gluconobacter potus]